MAKIDFSKLKKGDKVRLKVEMGMKDTVSEMLPYNNRVVTISKIRTDNRFDVEECVFVFYSCHIVEVIQESSSISDEQKTLERLIEVYGGKTDVITYYTEIHPSDCEKSFDIRFIAQNILFQEDCRPKVKLIAGKTGTLIGFVEGKPLVKWDHNNQITNYDTVIVIRRAFKAPKTRITKAQIAKRFKIKVSELEIVD